MQMQTVKNSIFLQFVINRKSQKLRKSAGVNGYETRDLQHLIFYYFLHKEFPNFKRIFKY